MTYIIISENTIQKWKHGFLKLKRDNQRLTIQTLTAFHIWLKMELLCIMHKRMVINILGNIGIK